MPTKLTRYCDGLLEALWLTAIIIVPVFFNIYSSRIFEPDKLTLLRSLTLVMLAAWIIKIIDQGLNIREIKNVFKIPLLIPAIATASVYIVSTIFSVTRYTSLWGSYQRLQGTYTTLSYLIMFFVIIANLRKWEQVERLISTIVIASLPVSLYGVLQRYRIDPIPWGGDVSARIASNMGNAIFVAAYLIMAFPITIGRIIESFRAILQDKGFLLSNFTRATAYVFIASLQIIALYFTGSRGPTLGWLTGGFVLALMLALIWRKRNFVVFSIVIAFLGAAFLLILNIKGGPLESLRNTPAIGRFGQLVDEQSNNARVRNYIWIGAVKLVAPHEPLKYPDGRIDVFNPVRPIIGYGPESMYVAYNPFYPPELTQVEKRNASPDRSHNETWDSLVITGVLGFLVYLLVFSSIFYYGLKWIGLVRDKKQKTLLFSLIFGCGILFGLGFVLWRNVQYVGVGLPFGMVIGLIIYFTYISLLGNYQYPQTEVEIKRGLLLAVLLSAVIAHFVEINFGIAIAVTRTYFWLYSALILLIGYILSPEIIAEAQSSVAEDLDRETISIKKRTVTQPSRKRRRGTRLENKNRSKITYKPWVTSLAISIFILTVLMITLGYEFISAAQGGKNAFEVLWNSFVRLRNIYSGVSYGVFAMFITSWLVGSVILCSENEYVNKKSLWFNQFLITTFGTLLFALVYWLWHAGSLVSLTRKQPTTLEEVLNQVGRYESLLTQYYIYLFLIILIGALVIVWNKIGRIIVSSWRGALVSIVSVILIPFMIASTNIKVIQGDIAFKLAEPFNKETGWPVAIEIYKHAIDLSPLEDYYYLFLGRAYLEYAKIIENPTERDILIGKAENDLKTAQKINPLNTDHTANLARLYSLWSVYIENPNLKKQKAETSSNYFSLAVTLSPNNARLWDEWALLYLNSFSDLNGAFEKLSRAEELDPYYDWTKALLGEYYLRYGDTLTDINQKNQAYAQAMDYYSQATELATDSTLKLNYILAETQLAINSQQFVQAINLLNEVILYAPTSPDLWKYEQTLAQLYIQTNDYTNALEHANRALQVAPEDQKQVIQNFILQLQTVP